MIASSFRRVLLGSALVAGIGLVASLTSSPARAAAPANTLTPEETSAGWQLLWDGRTTAGWRSAKGTEFPKKGWQIADGVLTVQAGGGGGDIVTEKKYSDFEVSFDFRITPGANSGVKYFVDTVLYKKQGSNIGLEYQVLDDVRHPDAKLGRNGDRTLGSLYDLIPASAAKKPNPIGEWNTGRIVSRGAHVEHWLNGAKILEYDRFTPEFRKVVAESKYAKLPQFGELKEGNILLQDHGNEVSYRNLKIRVLTPKS